jgi:hypothetical protein
MQRLGSFLSGTPQTNPPSAEKHTTPIRKSSSLNETDHNSTLNSISKTNFFSTFKSNNNETHRGSVIESSSRNTMVEPTLQRNESATFTDGIT